MFSKAILAVEIMIANNPISMILKILRCLRIVDTNCSVTISTIEFGIKVIPPAKADSPKSDCAHIGIYVLTVI